MDPKMLLSLFGLGGQGIGEEAGSFKQLLSDPLAMATVLGQLGSAISPPNSWQSRLGGTAAELAANAQARKYLSSLFGDEEAEPIQPAPKSVTKSTENQDIQTKSPRTVKSGSLFDPEELGMIVGGMAALSSPTMLGVERLLNDPISEFFGNPNARFM